MSLSKKSTGAMGMSFPSIVSRVLESQGVSPTVENPSAAIVTISISGKPHDPRGMLAAVARALVKEACGADKGVVKRPDGDVVVDLSGEVPRVAFDAVIAPSRISFAGLPVDAGVSAIAELTYLRCLAKEYGTATGVVEGFPSLLTGASEQRVDFFVGGTVILQCVDGAVKVHTKNIEAVMGRMASSSFVESTLPPKWAELNGLSVTEVADLLEDVQAAISDYWKESVQAQGSPTQGSRAHAYASFLMSHIGTELRTYLKVNARGISLFRVDKKLLEGALGLMDDWAATCQRATTLEFTGWGEAFVDVPLERFRHRADAILHLRDLHDEVSALLDDPRFEKVDGRQPLRADTLWDAFDHVDAFDVTPANIPKWEAAVTTCNRRLEPLEHRCADRLRVVLQSRASVAPQVVMGEFLRFKEVVKRPIVARELVTERDALLARLSERVQSIKIDFEQRSHAMESEAQITDDRRAQTGRYLPAIINKIVWLRQIRGRLSQMLQMRTMMLADLTRSEAFRASTQGLLSEVEDYEQESFRNWTFDIQDQAKVLMLDSNASLVTIDKDGKIEVNYPERLVQLLREVRILTSMGFTIPSDIAKIAATAGKFYQNGVTLKQLAQTYNGMHGDIIRSTRAMLLDAAVNFEKVVMANTVSKLTWSNTTDTERFIDRLRKASSVLVDDNRRLHRLHAQMGALTVELFKIDLLRSKERWMGRVRAIRERIVKSGFHNTEAWTRHWDMQIYKALEYQYRLGLESLHEVLPEIRADISFDSKTGRVVLRPPIEVLREQYYAKVRDFVAFPTRFPGVGNSEFFAKLPSRNEASLLAVAKESARLFDRVLAAVSRFQPMLVLGACGLNGGPSLEDIVEAALSEVQHWESNVRLLKQKAKEMNAVDTFIKIDCITLSTAGVKSALEEQLTNLGEVLNTTLRKSAQKHLDKIAAFLDETQKTLDAQFTKVDDLNRMSTINAQLNEKRPEYEAEFHNFTTKNRLYMSLTNSNGIPHKSVKSRWEQLTGRLDSFEKEMETQMEQLKASVGTSLSDFWKTYEKFQAQWHELKPKDPKSAGAKASTYIAERLAAFQELKERSGELKAQAKYFDMDEPDFSTLSDLEEDIKMFQEMWKLMDAFNADVDALRQEPWIGFRSKLFKFDDLIKQWQESLAQAPSSSISLHMRTVLDQWSRVMPVLKFVRGDGMMPVHWAEMFKMIRLPKETTADSLTFGALLEHCDDILGNEKPLKQLHARALGEAQIREALDDVRAWGKTAQFKLIPHSDRAGVTLITEWKEIMTQVNDNQALLFSIKDSPFFRPFADDASQWEQRLATLDELLVCLNQIQRKWVYLQPIFARGALPQEQARFERIDKDLLGVMATIAKDPLVVSFASHAEYKEKLKGALEQLDRCQKALNEFLEQKRDRFPRFYFISDDDLLEILGQSRNVHVIQSHLKKLFMGINSVVFDAGAKHIIRIASAEGEVVPLLQPVEIKVEVEDWLSDLDVSMKQTLQRHVVQCSEKLEMASYASQVLCTAEQIHFTKATEEAFADPSKGGLKAHKANLTKQLRELTTFAATNSDAVLDLKLKALIMDLIHMIEVVDLLIARGIDNPKDWLWRKQLRFYLDRGTLCSIHMVDATFRYTYEYQGNAPKLVHTPLTDKCYLTLTQGMHLGYGGNPYGPAGTGKTESVKALGNAMGRQVLVFNCDEGIDFKSMGRIFTGLVKCGAWGCFDEFNRLKVDQLSAVSQMIQVIQEALKQGESECNLLGRRIDVNPNAGIFVTLNPAGKGYGGRSKLPDNLKQLFRSVAMTVPDNQLITETILFSEGFENAVELAKKTVEIFRLSKQLLSFQQHYDWGLRALKAVLRLGGTLVHQYLKEKAAQGVSATPEEIKTVESEIIIKSLRVNTLSKLTFDDVKLFNGLIADVFPGIVVKEIDYAELRPAIVESFADLKLQKVEGQVDKILQLYEALNQRMGVVLVGPSGCGKSTALRVLRHALTKLSRKVKQFVMNPKAMPREQLLGRMDPDTREWFDGVLTEAAKNVVKEELTVRSWIVCDGDIDPEWVESLNSVLDDNKLLTMPNGVRIQFGSNVNFVFETHTLQFASPATVSRMGMIFMSEEDVEPRTLVASWLEERPADVQQRLKGWIDEYFFKAIDVLVGMRAMTVETTRMGLVLSGLSQLVSCTSKAQFAIGLVMGLGTFLDEGPRADYAKDVYHMCGERIPDPKRPLDCYYNVNRGALATFQYEATPDVSIEELKSGPLVRTVEAQRALCTMEAWVAGKSPRPFILVGPEGCGKSLLLRHCFAQLTNVRVATINCSAQTVAAHVIQKLQQSCQMFNTNNGKVLRPKEADRLILVLKDLNLPKPDKYATVQLHSFLQQLILYQGFYDKDLEWVSVERLQIVGSMNPPGTTGRFPVAARFVAIVSVLCLSYPSKESLQTVYSDFFTALLQSPPMQAVQLGVSGKSANDFARVLVTVYEGVFKKYSVDVASHYVFNPRDVSRWIMNTLQYNMEGSTLTETLLHEGMRIFGDRIVDLDDRNRFERTLVDQLASLGWQRKAETAKEPPVYIAWMEASAKQRRLHATKVDDLKKATDKMLIAYGRDNADLDLQLLPDTLQWLARIDRILALDGGCPLVVARSGVGAAHMLRLAAYQLKMPTYTLQLTRTYGLKAFKADLKAAILDAGINGTHCVLLLEDYMLFNPSFLEMVNSLLASGEVPGLFTSEELEPQLAPMKEDALAEGYTEGVYTYFVARVSKYLHVSIAMDATHPDYELRCRSNPALFTRCSVCWIGAWTADTMRAVPKLLLRDVLKDVEGKEGDMKLAKEFVLMHQRNGDRFSPQHFKTLLLQYREIYRRKSTASDESLGKLKGGLAKLAEAEISVDTISKEVTEKKVQMEEKQKEADQALVKIREKMEESTEQKKNINKIRKELDADRLVIQEKSAVVEARLSTIQPTLDAAKEAIGAIQPSQLHEVRSMTKPPAAVQDVLEGVLTIMGEKDISWAAIKRFLLDTGLKKRFQEMDPTSLTRETRANVQKILDAKGNSFKEEVISRASRAAAPMAAWLKATIEYNAVFEQVEPMHREMDEYKKSMQKNEERMQRYEEKLKKLEGKVEDLRNNFEKTTKEGMRLKDRLEKAEGTLVAAQELLAKLSAEKGRWGEQAAAIQRDMNLVPKRALVAAAFMTYLGREPEDVRRRQMQEWMAELKIDAFQFFTFLRTESTMLQFKAQGLPSDELSMDNSIIILDQIRTPLIVDPAGQAAEWLKNNLKAREVAVEVCTPADDRFMNILELSARFGKTLLITEVDRIEPVLYPLLRREFRNDGAKRVVVIGDKQVDVADTFQLYLVTRSTDLRLTPDIASYLTETSFSITRSGLEGQLLGRTIQKEQPELETQKLEILHNEESLKLQLAGLEDQLLQDLSQSQGSLLENKTLIDSLNLIKTQAQSIEAALLKSRELSRELDEKREVYRPLAARGSRIFFLVRDLKSLSHMYQFSLSMFLDLFGSALDAYHGNSMDAVTKIAELTKKLQQLTVNAVSRALFKADRIAFGVHLAKGLAADGGVPDAAWDFFIDKAVIDAPSAEAPPSWVSADIVAGYRWLAGAAPEALRNMNVHETDTWYQWMRDATPEVAMPAFLKQRVSAFQRLMIVKALRPDRLMAALNLWACDVLSVPSLSDASSLEALLPMTNSAAPTLLITTPGADPSMELQAIAHERIGRARFHQIAMGGGQTDEALAMLRQCAESGDWLCLKNLHLVIPWVSVLEQELNLLRPKESFRLWLTSEPHDEFPSILLSTSLKITFEAPPGIKQNLLRTYGFWNDEFLKSKTPQQGQLLFALSVLHATVQERRSYIPQGWAKFYEFSQADLKSATDVIIAQSGGNKIDWPSIHGILENAIYGGRMESDFDVRILRQYLENFFSEQSLPTAKRARALVKGISVPAEVSHAAFVEAASRISDNDIPAMFDLPPNSDRVVQRAVVTATLGSLGRLQQRREAGAMSREEWIAAISPVLQMWLQLCQPHAGLLTTAARVKRDPNPVNGFVGAEVENSLALVALVEASMSSLRKVTEGTLLLSEKLRVEADAMIAGEVPLAWDGQFSGPEAIGLWLRALVRKAASVQTWSTRVADGSLLKSRLDLSDLFRPITFLNALRQETARHTREPLVSLKLVSSIRNPPVGCAIPVCITGLLLQGAAIDTDVLSEVTSADASVVTPLPEVYVGWVPASDEAAARGAYVTLPLYTNLAKDTHLTELRMKCASDVDVPKFILAGAALFLEM